MRHKTAHTAIQKFLKESLPGAQIEKKFTEIGRIADVVYFPQKIIYEIQYSSIDLEEVIQRNNDYASLGFHVIWILHDHHFNQSFVSPAELYLRKKGAYYTSFTSHGHGFFYDQLDFFHGGLRVYKGKPILLKDFIPHKISRIPFSYPQILKKRLRYSPYHLKGDLIDSINLKEARILEKAYNPRNFLKKGIINRWNYLLKKTAGPDVLPLKYTPLEGESIKESQEKGLD
jgi:hypothetical protein